MLVLESTLSIINGVSVKLVSMLSEVKVLLEFI